MECLKRVAQRRGKHLRRRINFIPEFPADRDHQPHFAEFGPSRAAWIFLCSFHVENTFITELKSLQQKSFVFLLQCAAGWFIVAAK
jgi:hypothetical protein